MPIYNYASQGTLLSSLFRTKDPRSMQRMHFLSIRHSSNNLPETKPETSQYQKLAVQPFP